MPDTNHGTPAHFERGEGRALGPPAAASPDAEHHGNAPEGTSETRYCMNIDATTGTRIERVKCWTRKQWADQGVDVDKAWAEEGVRVIG